MRGAQGSGWRILGRRRNRAAAALPLVRLAVVPKDLVVDGFFHRLPGQSSQCNAEKRYERLEPVMEDIHHHKAHMMLKLMDRVHVSIVTKHA